MCCCGYGSLEGALSKTAQGLDSYLLFQVTLFEFFNPYPDTGVGYGGSSKQNSTLQAA